MNQLVPFVLPDDFLPQILTGMSAVTISFLALIELSDTQFTKPHVHYLLFPFAVITLASTTIVMVSYLLWFGSYDFLMLRKLIFLQAPIRLLYNTLDCIIYIQRSRSLFTLHPHWKVFIMAFLVTRLTWQTTLQCIDFARLSKIYSFAQFLELAFSKFAAVDRMSQLVIPSLQALLVDGSMLFVIVSSLNATRQHHRHPSRRRLLRVTLLIVVSIALMLMRLATRKSSIITQSLSSGGIVVILALGAYVNIDLYMLDLALFQQPQTPALEEFCL